MGLIPGLCSANLQTTVDSSAATFTSIDEEPRHANVKKTNTIEDLRTARKFRKFKLI